MNIILGNFFFLISIFKNFIIVYWLLLLCSCSQNNNEDKQLTSRYFDLKAFFEQEVFKLDSIKPMVKKTIIKDGKKEKVIIKDISWSKELQLFIVSDINKPALKSSYAIDTILISPDSIQIIYSAKDGTLSVIQMDVLFVKRICDKIKITNKTQNNLYQSAQILEYYRNRRYRISGYQKVIFLSKMEYYIEGFFL